MKLLDLQIFSPLSSSTKVKLLRHYDQHHDLWAMVRQNTFEEYQSQQSWDVFGDAEYIISFIAERDKYAKFLGVWRVLGKSIKKDGNGYKYETEECPEYRELRERLIISWGDGTRSWAQWLHKKGNKDINEILPLNYVKDFPGFYDIVLSYHELKQMIDNPDSNREWFRMLSSISGVYLILNKKTGKQYIGSAYGRGGIWQRWTSYSKNPSGNNKLLSQELEQDPKAFQSYQFSILRVLEPSSTKDEVLNQERLMKEKLGSRSFGLNAN